MDEIIIGSKEDCLRSEAFKQFEIGVNHVREDYARGLLLLSAGPFSGKPSQEMINQLIVQVIHKNYVLIKHLGNLYRDHTLSEYYKQGEQDGTK